MENEPGIAVSHPACGSWTTFGSGPGHECMHVVTGWGLLGSCPPGNGGESPPYKESSPKAISGDLYVSHPTTVSMENGLGPAPGSPEKQPGSPSLPSIPETGQGATKSEGWTLNSTSVFMSDLVPFLLYQWTVLNSTFITSTIRYKL